MRLLTLLNTVGLFAVLVKNTHYGKLDRISQHRLSLQRIVLQWDDMLRLAGSLLLGRVPVVGKELQHATGFF
jgi:hypothetical protein